MSTFIRLLQGALNAYRTRDYIVIQRLEMVAHDHENAQIVSFDTFFRRTRSRDIEYEKLFFERENIDGKRLPTTMYSRRYVY